MESLPVEDLFDAFNATTTPQLPSNSSRSIKDSKRKREEENVEISSKRFALPPKPEEIQTADEWSQTLEKSVQVSDKTLDSTENSQGTTTLSLHHQIRHQVAVPPGYPYKPLTDQDQPSKPAKTYPFPLDPFQRVAINCIERDESVLVAAHTSAGKTVIAEYAIARSLQNRQRVIYTSPIKALSNQKYREFLQEFGDVGLMTGDVTINPDASCLVMTTEILRSMLYRGSEIIREVSWVVFDEIHYMRDKERGVVWEETLILLPTNVHHVFLSATIPNALQFASWIANLTNFPVHVVYTDYRPTPLQHYLFPEGGEGIFLCVDESGTFREENFQRAVGLLADGAQEKKKKKQKNAQSSDLYKLIKMIMLKSYQPVIVFSFSKRECESNALQLSKLDFNTNEEADMVGQVYQNAMASLPEDDRSLPQIEHLLPLLKRGIGIHHSGLLPILKEVIEILFQEGLIKVLFATETFSIGLNMPAKTVLFTSVRKWDGRDHRNLGSGEYIQMSGRAGRRGLDDRGIVILMLDEKMEPSAAKEMLKGEADPLNSAFHLGYNMILNLLRVEGVSPEYMLQKCFYQYQNAATVPQLEHELARLEKERRGIQIENEPAIASYYDIKAELEASKEDYRAVVNHPSYSAPFLQPGRLVHIKERRNHRDLDFGWGVIVSFTRKFAQVKNSDENAAEMYVVDVLLNCAPGTDVPMPCPKEEKRGIPQVVPVLLTTFDGLSSVRIFVPKDLKSLESRKQVIKTVWEVQQRFENVPLLDPISDLHITDDGFKRLVDRMKKLQKNLENHALLKDPKLDEMYTEYSQKVSLGTRIKEIKKQIQQAQSVLQLDELKARKRVLRRLGYIDDGDIIETKGRVACEISTGDELMLTELIFNGVFNDLTIEQTCGLLACFVFQEKGEEGKAVREDMKEPIRIMKDTARRIAKVSIEAKMPMDEEEYVNYFQTEMVDVSYAWAQGAKFSQIVKMTDAFEGSIIRAMRRLEEMLRQLSSAAKAIGNRDLELKFEQCIEKIKRGVVFAASLFL